jgi:hypothetical protein
MIMRVTKVTSVRNIGVGLLALLASLPLIYAQRSQPSGRGESESRSEPAARSEPAREPVERAPAFVDRADHGSIRHVDTNVTQRPVSAPRDFGAQQQVIVHRDVNADVNVRRGGSEFAFGARRHRLREGYARLLVNNQPYYYDDGIYYQQEGDDYQEVYPPVGADIAQLPDGAVEIDAGNLTYYYAEGAFYVEQDGGYVVAPTPIGVTVPEVPPGAVQVSFNGGIAYQFNGIYYQPVFVDGVTQYMTVLPQ